MFDNWIFISSFGRNLFFLMSFNTAFTCQTSLHQVFPLSVTSQLDGRAMPYWRPASQPQLQLGNARATLAIVVHHGAGRNGENYTSYMANAVINAGLSLDNVVVIGPQVRLLLSIFKSF